MRDKQPSEEAFYSAKIEKTLRELAQFVEQRSLQESVRVDKNRIVITNKDGSVWSALTYLLIIVGIPLSASLYFAKESNTLIMSVLILVWIAINLNPFYKIAVGEKSMEVHFTQKCIRVESITPLFSSFFKSIVLPFSQLQSFLRKEVSIPSRYSSPTVWLRLIFVTDTNRQIKAVDLSETLPFKELGKILDRLFSDIIAREKVSAKSL